MQKKIIALAVAAVASTAAFAQSNVTVYGVVDQYVGSFTAKDMKNLTSVNSSGLSGSRLGFKGVEDLGNGTKALFTLEYGITPDGDNGVGTTGVQARQQFVGLTGGFGTAVAGRLQTAGYDFMGATNALHGVAIDPMQRVNPTALINSSSRANNAVAYIAPTFSGVTLAVNHSRLDETGLATGSALRNGTATLASATYKNGDLTVAGVVAGITAAAGSDSNVKETGIGASYNFGVAKLLANAVGTKTGSSSTNRAMGLSAVVPVTAAGSIVVGHAQSQISGDNNDATSTTVAYLHSLSKRTTLYTGYQTVKNQSQASIETAGLATAAVGGTASALVAGINHSF